MKPGNIVRLVAYPAAALLIALVMAGHWLLFSRDGASFVLDQLASRVQGLTVHYKSGTVARGVVLRDVSYATPALSVSAPEVRIRPSVPALLAFRVDIADLRVTSLDVRYRNLPGGESSPVAPVNITTPVRISHAQAKGVVVRINDASPIGVDSVETAAVLGGATLSLERLHIVDGDRSLDGSGTVDLNAPFAFDSRFRVAIGNRLARPAIMLHGRAHGTQDRIAVEAGLSSPDEGTMSSVVEPGTGHFTAVGDIKHMDLAGLTGRAVRLSGAHIEAEGPFAGFHFSARGVLANPWSADLDVDLQGTGGTDNIAMDRLKVTSPGTTLAASAKFSFASSRLTARLSGKIAGRQVDGDADVSVPDVAGIRANGRIRVDGNQADFTTKTAGHVNVTLDAARVSRLDPRFEGRVTGAGSIATGTGAFQLTLASRRLTVAGQSLGDVQTKVSYAPANGARVDLSVKQWQQGETRLGGGNLVYTGADFTAGNLALDWRQDAATISLRSHLRLDQGRLQGVLDAGKVEVAGQDWSLASAAVFSASGEQATVADQCWQHEDGRLCVTGVNYANERLRLKVSARKLAFPAFSSDQLDVSADLAFRSPSRLRVEARGMLALVRPNIAMHQLQLVLSGNVGSLAYTADASMVNPWVDDARLAVQGTLTPDAVTFDSVRISAPDAALQMTGRYGIASGHLSSKLDGKWNGRKIEANAEVTGLPDAPKGSVRLALANNVAMIELAGANRAQATITAPDLSAVNPAWQGGLEGKGSFDAADSSFSFDATSSSVKVAGYLLGNVRADGSGKGGSVNASLSIASARYAGQPLGGGKVTLDGRIESANLALALKLPGGDFNAHALLGYRKGALSGHTTDGQLIVGDQHWKLQSPFEFVAASGVVAIGRNCWQDGEGHVCLNEAHIAAAQGQLDLSLVRVPLQIDKPWFAPDVSIDGKVDATLSGSLDARSGKPVYQGTFRFEVAGAEFEYRGGQPVNLDVLAEAGVRDNLLTGKLSAKTPKRDLLTASLRMPDVLDAGAFNGSAGLDTDDLGLVGAFIPQVENARGRIHAAVSVNTLVKPLKADVSLDVSNNASAEIPLAGITLGDLQLTGKGDARAIVVKMSATSGKGKATADGTITDLFSAHRKVSVAVKGTDFTVLNRPDMNLVASPDLTFTQDAAGNQDIAGSFQVVDGSFKMPELGEQARQPSSDVVIVSGGAQAAPAGRLSIHVDVPVKQFNVDMYGLKSGVTGAVLLTQQGNSPRHAQGTLNLVKGTYSRFGQAFDIDKGRLIFSGPLDNPLVDVVSSRTITDTTNPGNTVTVTLTLSGPANDIQSTISSNPAMSGANALAYLVLGHPLASSTGKDSQAMSGAALALGLKQALPITRQIQSALGLSQLTVSSNGVDSTSVVAGKRIGPDLYVEYDYDVFSRIGGILFNYHLTPKLSLETRTGQANSMQLIYSF